jgi:O-antigen/teichoic acid export membrane protein
MPKQAVIKIRNSWPIYASNIFGRGLGFVSRIILAKFFLGPAEFGQFTAVLIYAESIILLGNFGFSKAVIAHEEGTDDQKWTILTSLFLWNFFLVIITSIFSPDISRLLDLTDGGIFLRIVSPCILFFNVASIPAGYLNKELKFKYQIKALILSSTLFLLVGLILAYLGKGALSLVVAYAISLVVQGVVPFVSAKIGFKWHLNPRALGNFLKISLSAFLMNISEYLTRHYDNLIVNIFFIKSTLGSYFMAYTLLSLPTTIFRTPLAEYLFSALSTYKKSPKDAKEFYLRCRSWDLHFVFPSICFIGFFAKPLTEVFLGGKWNESIQFIYMLIPNALIWAIGFGSQGLLVLGQTKAANTVILFRNILYITCLPILTSFFGITGLLAGVTITSLFSVILGNFLLFKLLEAGFRDFLRNLIFGSTNAILGVVFVLAIRGLLESLQDAMAIAINTFVFFTPTIISAFLRWKSGQSGQAKCQFPTG